MSELDIPKMDKMMDLRRKFVDGLELSGDPVSEWIDYFDPKKREAIYDFGLKIAELIISSSSHNQGRHWSMLDEFLRVSTLYQKNCFKILLAQESLRCARESIVSALTEFKPEFLQATALTQSFGQDDRLSGDSCLTKEEAVIQIVANLSRVVQMSKTGSAILSADTPNETEEDRHAAFYQIRELQLSFLKSIAKQVMPLIQGGLAVQFPILIRKTPLFI